jgi:hypothetical protein
MDEAVFKMLYVHIPSLHPANYPDLEVSSGVQTAAVMGIGLLYQGSKNRRMAEMLLSGPALFSRSSPLCSSSHVAHHYAPLLS